MSPVPRDLGEQAEGELDSIPDPLAIANRYRYLPTHEIEHLAAERLRLLARRFRAASYSMLTAARRFEHRASLLDYQATHPDEGPPT